MFFITIKAGVKLDGLQPAGFHIIGALDRAAPVCRTNLEITCATGEHPPDDPHSHGLALDVSVGGFTPAFIVQVKTYLESILGPLFTVLYEVPTKPTEPQLQPIAYINAGATAPHFHLQPKKGTTWPPLDVGVKA